MTKVEEESFPMKERQTREEWCTSEIFSLMRAKQEIIPWNSSEYVRLNKNIKETKQAKKEWIHEKCAEIANVRGK